MSYLRSRASLVIISNTSLIFQLYLLLVELTDVLDRLRRLQMESPQLTTPPLLVMLNVLSRYRSSEARGLYGFSGSEHTRGRECSTTERNSIDLITRTIDRAKAKFSNSEAKNLEFVSFTVHLNYW